MSWKTYFDTYEEFEDAVYEAETNAKSGRDMDFVEDLKSRMTSYGGRTNLSEAQYDWLKRLARL
ncbi:MAG: hypothetical protein AB7U98_13665 [Candidatus Nitrosocosmicus sp.]